ncbi:MAG: DUF4245 family protein [Marmoricola sp.]
MPDKPDRYSLPWTGMVGALLVLVLIVVGLWALRELSGGDQGQAVATVQYSGWLKAGRRDGRLRMFAPSPMPAGWRATSASYVSGDRPRWHLGMLTGGQQYVGIEEGTASARSLLHASVDGAAARGHPVRVAGHRWSTWHDHGGDYALSRRLPASRGHHGETLLVIGSAPPAQVRALATSLRPRA